MKAKGNFISKGFCLLLFASFSLFMQSCCKCCSSVSDGGLFSRTYVHKYEMKLENSLNVFKQVIYPDHQLTDMPDTSIIEWKWFLNPPQTLVVIQTNIGWDTLIYRVNQSVPEYSDPACGSEKIQMVIQDPEVIYHTFDSVDIKTIIKEKTNQNGSIEETTYHILNIYTK